LEKDDFSAFVEYIGALKGGVRQRLLDAAKLIVDQYDEAERKAEAAAEGSDSAAAPSAEAEEAQKAKYKRAKKIVKALSYFGAGMV
jgi:hypothetical protein